MPPTRLMLSTRVPPALLQSLRVLAANNGQAQNAFYVSALDAFLAAQPWLAGSHWRIPGAAPRKLRPTEPPPDWQQMSVEMDAGRRTAIQALAKEQGLSTTAVIYTALDWIDQQSRLPGPQLMRAPDPRGRYWLQLSEQDLKTLLWGLGCPPAANPPLALEMLRAWLRGQAGHSKPDAAD